MNHIKTLIVKHSKLARFIATGGSAAVVEYIAFIILHRLGLHILVANSLSFACGLIVSFCLNRFWVFRSRDNVSTQFGMYAVLAVINLCISDALIWVAVNKLSMRALIAKLITMVLVAIWNYVIYTRIIFRHRPDASL